MCACRFPQGLEDVSKYPALIEELLSRNWSEAELAGVLRLNFLRVFEKVEKVRDGLHLNLRNLYLLTSTKPGDTDIDELNQVSVSIKITKYSLNLALQEELGIVYK